MNLYITKSKRKNKKYDLLDTDKKDILSFGDNHYSDYTMHKVGDRIYIYPGTEKKIILLKKLNQRLLCLLINITGIN